MRALSLHALAAMFAAPGAPDPGQIRRFYHPGEAPRSRLRNHGDSRRYIPKAGDSALDRARLSRAEAKRQRRAAGRGK